MNFIIIIKFQQIKNLYLNQNLINNNKIMIHISMETKTYDAGISIKLNFIDWSIPL
jgi:hypothetical protein